MTNPKFIPYTDFELLNEKEMLKRSKEFYDKIKKRRTIRHFSNKKIPIDVIKNCLLAAGTAPNGANMQPWSFVVITNKTIKKEIRIEAEKKEKIFYTTRATKEWLEALEPLGTDEHKDYLEEAPCLIAIFSKKIDILPNGKKVKQYYAQESVGIATGFLIAALHNAGLATLTHTPSPMGFLNKILNRPEYERPFLLLVLGYPSENAEVPNIRKKPLNEIADFIE
ncbi:MAG: nitroreductase family protein [Bacteroidetes bacterium]|nr:nitroreductase family protein [Bacteroidota bacterium]MCH8940897.1 nitroreductase family protein [Bacteroidota bacterium]